MNRTKNTDKDMQVVLMSIAMWLLKCFFASRHTVARVFCMSARWFIGASLGYFGPSQNSPPPRIFFIHPGKINKYKQCHLSCFTKLSLCYPFNYYMQSKFESAENTPLRYTMHISIIYTLSIKLNDSAIVQHIYVFI